MPAKARSIYFSDEMNKKIKRKPHYKSVSARLGDILRFIDHTALELHEYFSDSECHRIARVTNCSTSKESVIKLKEWDADGDIVLKEKISSFTIVELMCVIDLARSTYDNTLVSAPPEII